MSNNVHSDSEWKDSFLHGAARAFFVQAFADFVEDDEREDDGHDYGHPGCGGDWINVAPETLPGYAYALAGELWAGVQTSNPELACGIYSASDLAKEADGEEPDPSELGHYFAMEAIGHGVSWFDSHESFPITMPSMECSGFSFDPEAYRAE